MLKPTAERSSLALQHYESIRTSAIEVFCNKSAFGHDMRAHRAPTRQISVLVAAAMFTKAALWAGWGGGPVTVCTTRSLWFITSPLCR